MYMFPWVHIFLFLIQILCQSSRIIHLINNYLSEFSVSETLTEIHTALWLFPHSLVWLAHHIWAAGWREVYLIFMAVRPLRAGVTTDEWSMQRLRLAKTLTSFQNFTKQKFLQETYNLMFEWVKGKYFHKVTIRRKQLWLGLYKARA